MNATSLLNRISSPCHMCALLFIVVEVIFCYRVSFLLHWLARLESALLLRSSSLNLIAQMLYSFNVRLWKQFHLKAVKEHANCLRNGSLQCEYATLCASMKLCFAWMAYTLYITQSQVRKFILYNHIGCVCDNRCLRDTQFTAI